MYRKSCGEELNFVGGMLTGIVLTLLFCGLLVLSLNHGIWLGNDVTMAVADTTNNYIVLAAEEGTVLDRLVKKLPVEFTVQIQSVRGAVIYKLSSK